MNKKAILNTFRTWHRYLGLSAAFFVILLVVTGVLLQHANFFGFDRAYIKSAGLLSWYGIQADPVISYQSSDQIVSHSGNALYFNAAPLVGHYSDLKGAVATALGVVTVSNESLVFFNLHGELQDVLKYKEGLPDAALGISVDEYGKIIMRGLTAYWIADSSGLRWQKFYGTHPVWSAPIDTPDSVLQKVQQHSMEKEISIERLLLDMHSGRLLGKYGVFVMDIAALAMLLLAVSGIYMWSVGNPNDKNGRKNN